MGQPYTLWPPLYPILLSLVQIAGVTDPLRAAFVLQLITFGWLATLTTWLFTRIFHRNFALAFIGNALAGTGVALTSLFQTVGSDFLFIVLALSMVYLCDSYIRLKKQQIVWLMMLVCALAMLQRYIGVTLLLTGAWIIFHYSHVTIWEKIKRLLILGASVLPLGAWALSLPAEALVRGEPSSLLENMYWFTFSILTWLFQEPELYGHPVRLQFGMWMLWLGIFAGSLVVLKFRRLSNSAPVETPLFLFGITYPVILVLIASLSSFNSLDSRFVSPVFIPLVALLLVTAESVLSIKFAKEKIVQVMIRVVVYGSLLFVLGLSVYQSGTIIQIHRGTGQGYTSIEWENNDVIEYWQSHQPDGEYIAFSNYPAGVAVQAWHEVLSSPRRTAHPNVGEEIIPLDSYLPSLFEPGKDSYIVWIEPNEYTHVYSVNDLREIVDFWTLYESADGGVYRILPQKKMSGE